MKNYIKVIIAMILCFVVVTLIGQMDQPTETLGEKKIGVKIIDARENEVVLLDEMFYTNTSKLSDFLIELETKGDILLEYEDSQFGMFITGMGHDQLIVQDETKGYYWTYDSLDNAQCVKDTYCTSPVDLSIEDGNHFTFVLQGF